MTGAGERSSLPYEGKAPSSHTGKGPAPRMPSPAPSRPLPPEGSEEEWEEAKEEVEEGEAEAKGSQVQLRESREVWEFWPYFDRGAVCLAREDARKRQVHVLRCQEHKAWYLWHPPRPPGCALCPGGGADHPKELLKDMAEN